jgi:hypothetical protein
MLVSQVSNIEAAKITMVKKIRIKKLRIKACLCDTGIWRQKPCKPKVQLSRW